MLTLNPTLNFTPNQRTLCPIQWGSLTIQNIVVPTVCHFTCDKLSQTKSQIFDKEIGKHMRG